MPLPTKKSIIPVLVLLSLVIFYVLNNLFWFRTDTIPPYNDQAHHLSNYLALKPYFCNPFQGPWPFEELTYTPFYYFYAFILTRLFGETLFGLSLVNVAFFAVLLSALYAITRKLFGRAQGLVACLLVSFYPYIYGATRVFCIDFSLCALVTLNISLLLYSERLSKIKYTAGAIITCFFGMLTKQTFLIYILGPLLVASWQAIVHDRAWKRVLLFAVFGLLLPLLLYYFFFFENTSYLIKAHLKEAVFYAPDNSWSRHFFYLGLLPDQINWPNLLLFTGSLAALLIALFKKTLRHPDESPSMPEGSLMILAWLAISFLILSSAPLKDNKYSLPLLPAVALVSSWGLCRINSLTARRVLFWSILAFGIMLHYALLFNMSIPLKFADRQVWFSFQLKPYLEYMHKPGHDKLTRIQDDLFRMLTEHPVQNPSPIIGIADITRNSKGPWYDKDQESTYYSVVLNEWGTKYYIRSHHLPFRILMLSTISEEKNDLPGPLFDFLVSFQRIEETFPALVNNYKLCRVLTMPRGRGTIYLYIRTSSFTWVPGSLDSQWARKKINDRLVQKAQQTFKEGLYDESINLLNDALGDPRLAKEEQCVAYLGLASSYVEKIITEKETREDYKEYYWKSAHDHFNKALDRMAAQDPLRISFYSGLGYLAQRKGNFQAALDYLKQGLACYPPEGAQKEYIDICTRMGYCYLSLNDFALSREYFLKALTAFPGIDTRVIEPALNGLTRLVKVRHNNALPH